VQCSTLNISIHGAAMGMSFEALQDGSG